MLSSPSVLQRSSGVQAFLWSRPVVGCRALWDAIAWLWEVSLGAGFHRSPGAGRTAWPWGSKPLAVLLGLRDRGELYGGPGEQGQVKQALVVGCVYWSSIFNGTSGPQLQGGWGFIAVDGGLVSEARPPIPAPTQYSLPLTASASSRRKTNICVRNFLLVVIWAQHRSLVLSKFSTILRF